MWHVSNLPVTPKKKQTQKGLLIPVSVPNLFATLSPIIFPDYD